jgi:hypothetical protein
MGLRNQELVALLSSPRDVNIRDSRANIARASRFLCAAVVDRRAGIIIAVKRISMNAAPLAKRFCGKCDRMYVPRHLRVLGETVDLARRCVTRVRLCAIRYEYVTCVLQQRSPV